jgi:hypothetical protein
VRYGQTYRVELSFKQKTGRWIMPRIVIVILIYRRHKPIDPIQLDMITYRSQDKNPLSQQSVNMLYCVLFKVTTCFCLRKRPSSGDYHVIQNIKKKVAIRCKGSVESNSMIIG